MKKKILVLYIRFWVIALFVPCGLLALILSVNILDSVENIWHSAYFIADDLIGMEG